jgi:hypothetical protein
MDSSPESSIHGMGRVPNTSSSLSCGMLVSRTVRRLLTKLLSWGESSTPRPFGPRLHRPPLPNPGSQPARSMLNQRTQRNASLLRDEHQRSRLFARWNQLLRHSPNSNRITGSPAALLRGPPAAGSAPQCATSSPRG